MGEIFDNKTLLQKLHRGLLFALLMLLPLLLVMKPAVRQEILGGLTVLLLGALSALLLLPRLSRDQGQLRCPACDLKGLLIETDPGNFILHCKNCGRDSALKRIE